MFITLTLADGSGKVALIPYAIQEMLETEELTKITLTNGNVYAVKEKIARIIALIKQNTDKEN